MSNPSPSPSPDEAAPTLREALTELVALHDLKSRADAISPIEPGCEKEVLKDEYWQRYRPAWKAARAALAAPEHIPDAGKMIAAPTDERAADVEAAFAWLEKELQSARACAFPKLAARIEKHIASLRAALEQPKSDKADSVVGASSGDLQTALLPCPFCGGKPHLDREYDPDGCGVFYAIRCTKCHARSRQKYASNGNDCPNFYAEVRAEWNTRAAPRTAAAAARDVLAERERQKTVKGYEPAHDDEHASGELAIAAACYAMCEDARDEACSLWPWEPEHWKPRDARANLVRAGALVLAEIERLDRAAS